MSKALRITLAAIAATLLVGLAPLSVPYSQLDRQLADPEWPTGG